MPFARNLWYVAAWGTEVGENLLGRKIIDVPVLLYRDGSGRALAIGNACPHKFAPLHLGRHAGDVVECLYHGLHFDGSGACVFNPHGDGAIPDRARVPAYPLVERHDLLWIWMGEPALADPRKIPDFSRLTDPTLHHVRGTMNTAANYQIVADNLLDLSHSMFLHANFHRTKARLATPQKVEQDGDTVWSRRFMANSRGPASLMRLFDDPETPVDYWLRFAWQPPGVARLDTGVTLPGRPESEGFQQMNTHLLTPETETTTHYFFSNGRGYSHGDPAEDEKIREWQRVGFGEQDKPMIEAIQDMVGTADPMSLKPILLPIDTAAIFARRIMTRLVAAEAAETEGPAQTGSHLRDRRESAFV